LDIGSRWKERREGGHVALLLDLPDPLTQFVSQPFRDIFGKCDSLVELALDFTPKADPASRASREPRDSSLEDPAIFLSVHDTI
jgi:hypothetical protein